MAYRSRFARYTPTQHDHVGEMVYEDRACWCEGCGQRWELSVTVDHFGKTKTKWVPQVSGADGMVGA